MCTIPRDDTNIIYFFQIHQKWLKIQYFLLQENFTVKNLTILIFTFKNDKKCRYKKSDKKRRGGNRKMRKYVRNSKKIFRMTYKSLTGKMRV